MMEIILLVVVVLCISVAVFSVLMLFRNEWVYKTLMKHSKAVYVLMEKKIDDGSYSIVLSEQYYDCIWNGRKMFYHFWIWDLRKMVNDQKMFDEVYATDDLEAVRKRVVPNTHAANLTSGKGKQ